MTTAPASHRTEQLAGVAGGLHRQRDEPRPSIAVLISLAWLEVSHLLGLAGATDVVHLLLRTARRDDRQPARKQEVAAVAVFDLDGVAGGTEVVHVGGQNELHCSLFRSALTGYRVEEVKGSSATSRAFLTAIATSRWCCTQLPVTRRARILPRSLMYVRSSWVSL